MPALPVRQPNTGIRATPTRKFSKAESKLGKRLGIRLHAISNRDSQRSFFPTARYVEEGRRADACDCGSFAPGCRRMKGLGKTDLFGFGAIAWLPTFYNFFLQHLLDHALNLGHERLWVEKRDLAASMS